MFVCPASSAYVSPELRFFRTDDARTNKVVVLSPWLLNWPVKDVADLDRSVAARTEQIERSDPCERAHFMKHWRAAVDIEALNDIQRGRAQFREYAESETLSDRRVDAIEDCVCPSAFNPLSTAAGEQTTSCLRVQSTRVPLGALQTSRECEVRKQHCGLLSYTTLMLANQVLASSPIRR